MLRSWDRDVPSEDSSELSGDMLIELLPDALVVLDRNGQVLRCNRAFSEMWRRRAVQNPGERRAALVADDQLTGLYQGALAATQDGAGQVELECVLPGVGVRTLHVAARLVGPEGGHPIVIVLHDVTDERAQDQARSQFQMTEIAHRVKNSLQILASSAAFEQRREAKGASDGYRAMHRRILAIASLYDVIGLSGGRDTVDARDLLLTLAEGLRRGLLDEQAEVEILVEGASASLAPRTAEAIGLIVNELATNAIKHAFPAGRGSVRLRLTGTPLDGLVVGVIDDGCGMSDEAKSGVGSAVVKSLVTELKASMTRTTGAGGTEIIVRLPPGRSPSAQVYAIA